MIVWPADLISDLARRKTVVFMGSGISRNSQDVTGRHPKTWAEFLNHMCASAPSPIPQVKTLLKEKDFLTACEIVKRSIGQAEFDNHLRAEFLSPGYQHARIHEHIFALDSRIVATPNFDKIYDTYANYKAGSSVIVKYYYDPDIAQTIRGKNFVILKVHGTIDTLGQIIFTRREYAIARVKYASFYALLEALALTHTFLFLGCSVYDPDIRLLLEDVFFRHPSSPPHVFVLPARELHESVRAVVQESMNLKILTYKSTNAYKELEDSIGELVHFVDDERDRLKIDGNW
ncbi:MAG: SIR2 family protein [Euryarchaeota archaeon]